MILYDVPSEIYQSVNELSKELMLIDNKDNQITLFPDFIIKRGFPSGIVIKAKNKIYPCAIPDIGCGFRVVKIKGMSKEDFLGNKNLINKIDIFLSGKGQANIIDNELVTLEEMLRFGHICTNHLFLDKRISKYEDSGCFNVDDSHEFKEDIFPLIENISIFNSYQGHFLEFLEPLYNTNKECYLLIHTGSFILADNFNMYYYPLLAEMSYVNDWSSEIEVRIGKFNIPRDAEIIEEYYNDVKALMNFSVSYRDLIERKLFDIINEEMKEKINMVLLSDYFHTKLDISDEYITHQRGIQQLVRSDELEYIISGNFGIASLLFKSNIDAPFSHGVPVDTSLYNIEDMKADYLLSSTLIKEEEREKHLKSANLAQLVYHYYLKKDITFVNYLIPFYSFKTDN